MQSEDRLRQHISGQNSPPVIARVGIASIECDQLDTTRVRSRQRKPIAGVRKVRSVVVYINNIDANEGRDVERR